LKNHRDKMEETISQYIPMGYKSIPQCIRISLKK
jgi:hypothetical protein